MAEEQIRAVRLRTAGLDRALGIDDRSPSLAWRIEGPAGTMQARYRLLVASSLEGLERGEPDLWDSGTVESGASTGIRYAGTSLSSRQRCWWRVLVWAEGETVPVASEISWWEMGLLEPDDWHGDWLAAESQTEREDWDADPLWVDGPVAFGKSRAFRLPFAGEGRGTLVLAADGYVSELRIDGILQDIGAPPPKGTFGEGQILALPIEVGPGDHELTIEVKAAPLPLPRREVGVSAVIRFETGRRIVSPWQTREVGGEWTAAPEKRREGGFPSPPSAARLFRHEFALAGEVVRARLYGAALGACAYTVNGHAVGNAAIEPGPTDFRDLVPYCCHDVTELLGEGPNLLAAHVGDGFFASAVAPTGRYSFGPAPRRFRAMLVIELVGGETVIIGSDETWRTAASSILSSEIYNGEVRDLRLEPEGWAVAGFDDSAWPAAHRAPSPAAALVAPLAPPIRETRVVRPLSITAKGDDRHIVDFGQNFAGRVRLRVRAPAGSQIMLRHAEILDDLGELDVSNLRAAEATDIYILASEAETLLEPRFTYHGFRFAEVRGLPSIAAADIEGVVLCNDLPETGLFEIDQPIAQKLWQNTLWSQRSNFVGVPTDCPQRDERLGWTGDAQIFWDTAAYNMDVAAFTRSFTREMRVAQGAQGAFPMWAPTARRSDAIIPTPLPGWADAGVELPYTAYLHSGDRQIIDDNWDAMTRYLEGILAANPDYLWLNGRGYDLGDWLSLDAVNPYDETTPKPLIGSAMLTRSLSQVAQMAAWTARGDEASWRQAADKARAAFAREYVASDGTVGNGSHSSYILALRLGLVPEPLRPLAGAKLAAAIRERGTLLTTGFLGTPLALDALADVGETGLAYTLLMRTEYPSWGYMVERGATTIWERWNGDTGDVAMNSYNHYALGAVCAFLYRRVAGIEPIEPGFGRFAIRPLADPRIGSAGATYESVRGTIRSHWRHVGDVTEYRITVPANSIGELELPAGASGDLPLRGDGASGAASAELRPGTYLFTAPGGGSKVP